ncbi:amyloid protein-binding protein 2-like [Uranotaenia lowii]|uniref:amyloid protein-binding protein 2-like n=1 Tax=Uranotaenia lowii TaxID=190385 RepID=UPI00247A9CDA|nr:amyloid protein-binding protein 2-like [Uranotaenia lowii]
MMMNQIYNCWWGKGRWYGVGGHRIKNPEPLDKQCIKVIVAESKANGLAGKRISRLFKLPNAILVKVFDEMADHNMLRNSLYLELQDPILFIKIFRLNSLVVHRIIKELTLAQKPIVLKLVDNYITQMKKESKNMPESVDLVDRVAIGLELGAYLYDYGWWDYAILLLEYVRTLLSLIKDDGQRKKFELRCLQQSLQVQGISLKECADCTFKLLHSMIATIDDKNTKIKTYLLFSRYFYNRKLHDKSHQWNLKALNLMDEFSPSEDLIEILQLMALFCCSKESYAIGNELISQAMKRGRTHYGSLDRRYADVIESYGFCLLEMDAFSRYVSIFMEQLDIITRIYGLTSPHVPMIMSWLAYGLYMKSHTANRFDMAEDQIRKAIDLAEELQPERTGLIYKFKEMRTMIQKGHDPKMAAIIEREPKKAFDFECLNFAEIRAKYLEFDASIQRR